MVSSSAHHACRHFGRVVMLACGAIPSLLLALAVDTPSVMAADSGVGPIPSGIRVEKRPMPGDLVANERLADILDGVADGQSVVWRDPKTDVTYRIHPLVTFMAGSRNCRAFTIRWTIDGSAHESYRTACREADGRWTISNTPDPGSAS